MLQGLVGGFCAALVFCNLDADGGKAIGFQHHRKTLGGGAGGIDRIGIGTEMPCNGGIVKVDARLAAGGQRKALQLAKAGLDLAAVAVLDRIIDRNPASGAAPVLLTKSSRWSLAILLAA